MSKKFAIDSEFRKLLPVLKDGERELLKSGITEAGRVLMPLIVWKEEGILVDGHNRYDIATELGLEYDTIEQSFADRDEVKIFILSNNIGRRNLTPIQLSDSRGQLYNITKKKHGDAERFETAEKDAEDATGEEDIDKGSTETKTTAEVIAEQFGVSASTIERDGKKAKLIDDLAADVKTAYMNNTLKLTDNQLKVLASKPKSDQSALAREHRTSNKEWDKLLKIKKPSERKAKAKTATPDVDPEAPPRERMNASNEILKGFTENLEAFIKDIPEMEWIDDKRKQQIAAQIRSAVETAKLAKGSNICPRCKGENCKHCRMTGFVPKGVYEQLQASSDGEKSNGKASKKDKEEKKEPSEAAAG